MSRYSPEDHPRRGGAWAAFVSSDRRRSWLVAGLALAVVVSYLIVWAVYSGAHTYPRYRQLPAGAVGSFGVEHYRVLKMTRTASAVNEDGSLDQAPANTVWVIAEIQVQIDRREDSIGCSLDLLGPDGRRWSTGLDGPDRSAPNTCDNDKVTPGQPYTFESVYEIPSRYGDQLRGLVVIDDLDAKPNQVISPAG